MSIEESGSVRADLLGGTLDLDPISLIIPQVVTINMALSLQVKVKIEERSDGDPRVEIFSKDYNQSVMITPSDISENIGEGGSDTNLWGPLSFAVHVLSLFPFPVGVKIEISSMLPAGSGLGGSSCMGITLYKALEKYCSGYGSKSGDSSANFTTTTANSTNKVIDHKYLAEIVNQVKGIESKILNAGPAGYQDFYPALYGGVLALLPHPGKIEVRQLFSPQLKDYLESHFTLVYSGESRHSGINNWEVYKGFFDGNPVIREALAKIAKASWSALEAIKTKNYSYLKEAIKEEGAARAKLSPNILTPAVSSLEEELKANFSLALKVCGAGGGGCFLLVHELADREGIEKMLIKHQMKKLDFKITNPL